MLVDTSVWIDFFNGHQSKQAENAVRVLSDAQDRLVTSEYFDSKMQSLDARLESVELRLTIKLGAFMAVAAGVIIAALRAAHGCVCNRSMPIVHASQAPGQVLLS